MATGTSNDEARNAYLFQHLIAMFQTLALQQLGKLINPITGKLERDLQQAKITIDMLQMLREKTEGNLSEDERRLLENIIVELQMNFVDETNREKAEGDKAEEVDGKDIEDSVQTGKDYDQAAPGEELSAEAKTAQKSRKGKKSKSRKKEE